MKNNLLTEDQVFVDLKTIVSKLMKLSLAEVDGRAHQNSNLRDDLGIDSVESLDFLTAVEELYSIKISDEEATTLQTVADVITLIMKKKNG